VVTVHVILLPYLFGETYAIYILTRIINIISNWDRDNTWFIHQAGLRGSLLNAVSISFMLEAYA
jgi:hypothetical protein